MLKSILFKVVTGGASVVIVCGVAEFFLRVTGVKPGYTQYQGFVWVDSLYELKGMEADSAGLFKVRADVKDEIDASIKKQLPDSNYSHPLFDYHLYSREQYSLAEDFLAVLQGRHSNEFSNTYFKILKKSKWTAFDSAFVNYAQSPINDDGFRSIPFSPIRSKRPSVLLLGDSYTWGHHTNNITNSFADILLARGYVVYNAGIGGTDASQYLLVAERYLKILKPDFVVVNFNLGNDVQYFNFSPKPHIPIQWVTNAGYLRSCVNGVYFDSKESVYKLMRELGEIPHSSFFNTLCGHSALLSRVWWFVDHHISPLRKTPQNDAFEASSERLRLIYPFASSQILEIKKLCIDAGAQFILVALPQIEHNGTRLTGLKKVGDFKNLFVGESFIEPDFPYSCYSLPDEHYNDYGHSLYAIFLDSLFTTKPHRNGLR